METKEQIDDIRKKILIGLEKSYKKLLETKRKNNGVLVISENGEIIKIKFKNK